MRGFIKAVLIFAIALFALFNYRFLTFSQGISKPNYDDMSALEVLKEATEIKTVQYYKKTVSSKSSENNYRIYIETADEGYLLDATEDDIAALDGLSVFNSNLKPRKVIIVPFYVEIIVGFIILILPFGRARKKAK